MACCSRTRRYWCAWALLPRSDNWGYPVHVRAVVTYYSPSGPDFPGRDTYMSAETPDLFIQDATVRIWVNLPKSAHEVSIENRRATSSNPR